jgi:hypothetical protein
VLVYAIAKCMRLEMASSFALAPFALGGCNFEELVQLYSRQKPAESRDQRELLRLHIVLPWLETCALAAGD